MHNNFLVIVRTGSRNFATTGLYGSDANRVLDRNTQNSVERNSPELASIFKTEFNEKRGSNTPSENVGHMVKAPVRNRLEAL
ncbi:hypothetical protein C8P63_1151 [Melghirimyces profundicolus]|uniref:Uncharacterized protein n=1 Tax=Melghirimyces profundicolus TaxID=1242148 RepID=A0A2T6BRA0_9BACL|nr:hypothetical protein [Melghirimyces profundicolus]PTX58603.1 hypothetical protein C8P63_1151 [Melghirimyces profundicolus]